MNSFYPFIIHGRKFFIHLFRSFSDRSEGTRVIQTIENDLAKVTNFTNDLAAETEKRRKLLHLLENAKVFYDLQLAEAEIVEKVKTIDFHKII